MNTSYIKKQFEHFFLPGLEKVPVISFYARTRGWPFVIAWMHRIAGMLLALYAMIHIYTLSLLTAPNEYNAKMKIFGFFIFAFLEWLLAIPVIFHALNGGRLILYEIFGSRNDGAMMRWVLGFSMIYVLLNALLMIMGNQSASPILFWLIIFIFSSCLVVRVTSKIWSSDAAAAWKLQRISGVFLLIMIPAHLLFMHLQPSVSHEANVVINRLQNIFIKLVDITLVIAVLFHAGYGLISISKDYIASRILQIGLSLLTIFIMAVLGWMGVKIAIIL